MSTVAPRLPVAPLAAVRTRVWQFVIDAVIVAVAGGGFGVSLGWGDRNDGGYGFNPLANTVPLLISALFFVGVPLLANGQTLGMMLRKIRVVDAHGGKPSASALLIRWLLLAVDALVFGVVGLVIMNSRDDHRRLGDIVAKTYVVRAD